MNVYFYFKACGNNVEPLKDSEGEYFWCGKNSVRSCPQNSACATDPSGYQICCPTSTSGSIIIEPLPPATPPPTATATVTSSDEPDCFYIECDEPWCPDGHTIRYLIDSCCGFECIPPKDRCDAVRCPSSLPNCPEGTTVRRTNPPEECCPVFTCETNGKWKF